MLGPEREIEELKGQVAKYFPVYEVRVRPDMLTFFVHVEPTTLDHNFDEMRKAMIPKGYVPFITKEKGEHIVLVQRKPPAKPFSVRVNLILLFLTIGTTIFAGAINWAAYEGLEISDPRSIAFGALFFALPLMAILGIHEMGHYVTAKKYKVAASLPFFVPSIPPLGTFGALISMRDPIPNRKALLDIGISGPLFGLAVAIPVTLLGLFLIGADPKTTMVTAGDTVALPSLLYEALTWLVPVPSNVRFHPTAFAGWVGMFVTALNLLPAGQLDGGHVARAVLGDKARYLSYFALATMFFLGLFFPGWLIIAMFILFLGARHPPPLNDITRLSIGRKAVGAVAAIVFLATFIPTPLVVVSENPTFDFVPAGQLNLTATAGSVTIAYFEIHNTGNMLANISVYAPDLNNLDNFKLNVTFLNYSGSGGNATIDARAFVVVLMPDQSVNVTFRVNATNYSGPRPAQYPYSFIIQGEMVDGPTKTLRVGIKVV